MLIAKQDDQSKILLRTSGESQIVFIQSLVFPMIDSYYMTLVYILTFVKNKGIDIASFTKSIQWLGELLFQQGSIQFFESCNQESIKNALMTYIEQGILVKTGMYVELSDKLSENEIIDMLEYINKFRSTS